MIVYVESNFVLEIALEQEQSSSAEAILELAESNTIELAFPSFALSEPFSTIMHRNKERADLHQSLMVTLRQLQRSEPNKQTILDLQPLLIILKNAVNREFDLLHSTVARLLKNGKTVELNEPNLRQALVYQSQFDLRPQDSVIYSTLITDMQQRSHAEAKCFLSRDKEAFSTNPAIRPELASYNCRYIGNFAQGLDFIKHTKS
jgi:predicted nucleic acid-binding protein